MFWIRSGLHSISISDWLTAGPQIAEDPAANLEDVRDALLEALGDAGARRASLRYRINAASDARALWELRQDVMNAVAQMHGESEGVRRLARVTERFHGLLPMMPAGRRRKFAPAAPAR